MCLHAYNQWALSYYCHLAFVGVGLYLLGITALGSVLEGVGLLVGAIGLGTIMAGYLFPRDSAEITNAVEEFERK